MRLLRVSALALAGLLASGCNSLNSPNRLIVLTVDATPSLLIPTGGSVELSITAQNAGTRAETVTGRADCLVYFEVFATGGAQVYDSRTACNGSTVTQTLDVDATLVQTFTWDGSDISGGHLAPGIYALRPSISLASGGYPGLPVTIQVE